MTSDGLAVISKWMKIAEEVKEWSAANPEIAAAWDSAMEEDEERSAKSKIARNEKEIIANSESALVRMGVPTRYAESIAEEIRLDEISRKFWNSSAMSAARAFVASKKSLLVLFGGTGSGKSCAAAWCLLRSRRRKPYDNDQIEIDTDNGRFIISARAFSIPRFDDTGEWKQITEARWLVIDEFAIETGGGYTVGRLNELLNLRYANKLRTIITCNLGKDEFRNRIGERITSRIRDDGMVCGCGTEDYRNG